MGLEASRNVCRSGVRAGYPRMSLQVVQSSGRVGAFEATHGKDADQLSKCQSCNLCGHSLRIKDGENKKD